MPIFNHLTVTQQAILKTYAGGEHEYLIELNDDALASALEQCGDGLLAFLIRETSVSEDCVTQEDAINRIDAAIRDLEQARAAVQGGNQ